MKQNYLNQIFISATSQIQQQLMVKWMA